MLATVAQHNVQRYYDEVARHSREGLDRLVDAGKHEPYLRPCNAHSVSAATGIPRETVRRKVRWLVGKGWLKVGERGQLSVVRDMSKDFEEFDLETIDRLHDCAEAMKRIMDAPKRTA